MTAAIRIALTADFNADNPGHRATGEALRHAADAVGLELVVDWIPTESTESEAALAVLAEYHGIFSPGGAYQSKDGALAAIRFARQQGWPFFGT
jgi:CTP synthase (UTP-ammonia lyase)